MKNKKWNVSKEKFPESGTKVLAITPSGDEQEFWFENGLWFFPDKSMYVYFVPVFWLPIGD